MKYFLGSTTITFSAALLLGASCTAGNTPSHTRGGSNNHNSDNIHDVSCWQASCRDGTNAAGCYECDRVHHLPGYDAPLPSPWYSGYLTYDLDGHTIHTHYVLVMAERLQEESDETHAQKPLLYWSNGGPGASSLFGLLTEVGPLWLNENSFTSSSSDNKNGDDTILPHPIYNPHGWTRLGHVVMIDQPAPVGFSYCESDEKCSDISWTDELAAENVRSQIRKGTNIPRQRTQCRMAKEKGSATKMPGSRIWIFPVCF